ncbi:MAG: BNR-4 repeat-containing protein [Planctomycetales bacterium]|nr:BNR-4 repeat-containing protein [Planctomycetales bacterium]
MSRFSSSLVLALAGLVLAPATANCQVNLPIVNGGFETGAATTVPSGWTVAGGSNPYWIGDSPIGSANPSLAYEGSQFISASWEIAGLPNANSLIGGSANSALIYQDVDLSPYSSQIGLGDRYLGLSYAYYVNDGNDFGSIGYEFYDSGNSYLGGNSAEAQAPSGGWRFVDDSASILVPANASRLRISIGSELNPGGAGSARNVAFDAISASLQPAPPPETPTGIVHGNLIQFDSDGNWTWYTDERAIVDPNNGHVLVNSVGFDETVQGGGYPGNVDVVNFNPTTGRRVRSRLSNQTGNPQIQNDDHNVGALLVLPDGRYLAMYANHGNNGGLGDEWSRWRRSIKPGDSTSWTEEQLFNWHEEVPGANETGSTETGNVSYHNLFYLSAEDQVYNISRSHGQLSTNGASQNMPNIMRYDMATNTVEWGGQLLESQAQGYSAYPKYVSNGVNRIYFTTTETHPRNFNNSIYAGYIENGQTFDMLGNVIDSDIFDNGTVAGGSGFVSDVIDFTQVQAADPLGQGYNRLWTTDMALDSHGLPMALYTSRWNIDGSTNDGSTNNPIDHRLHMARWNPTTQSFDCQEIAKMGGRLYEPEEDYTGLGALVPGDEDTLYISTAFDPRDLTGVTETANREIYKGEFDGSQWNWTAITESSGVDNLRPIVPDNHGNGPRTVLWFRGNYNTAHDINAAVVGIVEGNGSIGASRYVDANANNTTFANDAQLSTTAPSGFAGADDDQWHLRTGVGNGGSVLSSNESGTEDAPMLKTTLANLDDGLYDVFAYFWSDNDEDWRLLAGLESDNLVDFRRYGSQHAEADQFDAIELVTDNSNDLLLYRAYLGRTEVIGGDDIDVFIDDWQTTNGSASRTWYDGVGYALVSSGLPGDFDADGDVDGNDFLIWQRDPDVGDLADWQAYFGSANSSATSAVVPEPPAALLLSVGIGTAVFTASLRFGAA